MSKTLAVALALAALFVPVRAQALENEDLLALVAMPLAVAAVSEITDVPMNDLVDVVALMNDAAVPPPQFIEVVRYIPVALVVDAPAGEPEFVEYVRLREAEGLRGTQLVTAIEDRLRAYDLDVLKLSVDRPRVVDVGENFLPAVVRTRLAQEKQHPHGGPPGQLKKQAGVRTGAEIVHRNDARDARKTSKPRRSSVVVDDTRQASRKVAANRVDDGDRGRGRVKSDDRVHGNAKPHGGGHGNGNGKNKGHGKGKG